jgi:hypothetical protein
MDGETDRVDGPANDERHLSLTPGIAFAILLLTPVVAATILLVALALLRSEKTAVAVPFGSAIGFVVVIGSAVTLSAAARQIRRDREIAGVVGAPDTDATASSGGLSMTQGIVLLLTFVVLTAVPAAVVVGAITLLRQRNNLFPEFALPVILLVGLIGLLAVLAMMVAVFRRFDLVTREFPLGLPQGSIQAVIALSLILIFAIIGVYLHASAPTGKVREELSIQLFTTISTLVVAVAGFYFGAKSTKEAAESVVRASTRPNDSGAVSNVLGPRKPKPGDEGIKDTEGP